MYTATLLGDTKNINKRRRMVNIEFTNGENSVTKEFQFSLDTEVSEIKKKVRQYVDDLNGVMPKITGDIGDYTKPVEDTVQTTEELAKNGWDADRAKLTSIMGLVRDGVFVGDETQITALQVKVKKGFKTSYLG